MYTQVSRSCVVLGFRLISRAEPQLLRGDLDGPLGLADVPAMSGRDRAHWRRL